MRNATQKYSSYVMKSDSYPDRCDLAGSQAASAGFLTCWTHATCASLSKQNAQNGLAKQALEASLQVSS